MRDWLTVFAELYDSEVCYYYCFPFFVRRAVKPFGCIEEHEAMHVEWIQAMVTFDEYLKARKKEVAL